MVLRVVLKTTSQWPHLCRCFATSARVSAATESSMRSSSKARNSVQVTFQSSLSLGPLVLTRFLAEVAAEALAQLQAGAQQARLDGRNAQAKSLRCFLGGEAFNVAQDKDDAEARGQALDGFAQNLGQFGLVVVLLGIGRPVGQVAGNGAFLGFQILVDRNHFAGAPLAQPHQALVDRDSNQPCVEFRIPLKLIELFIGLENASCMTSSASSRFCVMCCAIRKIWRSYLRTSVS